jgi:hypothetical protein
MTITEYRRTANSNPAADNGHIIGYGAMFNKNSRNLGSFTETVDPSAFNESANAGYPDVICRYNHNPDALLGTTQAGTLKLAIDETGLFYDVDPPESRADVLELVRRGDVANSSFAFRVLEGGDEWTRSNSGLPQRRLLGVQLVDVAPVQSPAYPDSPAGVRNVDGAVASLSRRFDASEDEIRALMENGKLPKLFRLSARYESLAAKQHALELKRHDLTTGR